MRKGVKKGRRISSKKRFFLRPPRNAIQYAMG
jgi:hypothetical protein